MNAPATTEKNSCENELTTTRSSARLRLPPLRSLLAFDAAARHGNFTEASAELGVTPSAISHQIQLLEDFLGAKLFERYARQVVLSLEGKLYHQEIESALRNIAEATTRVAPQSQTDTLLILSSPSFAAKWLQPRLPSFMALEPNIRVRISTLENPSSLSSMRFDVGICYGAQPVSDMAVTPLATENVTPLCSPVLSSALGLRNLNDLSRATLIHSTNAVSWTSYFRHHGLPEIAIHNQFWLDRSAMAIEAAASGLGVVLESDILSEADVREGRLVIPFPEHSVSLTSYHLLTPRGYRSRRSCAAFVEWLRGTIPLQNRPSPGL
jgi:LysR family glycine cleavage system transcriptional activator